MMKRVEIEVDETTFADAFDAYEIVLKQKDLPHQIVFYAADAIWRDDENNTLM